MAISVGRHPDLPVLLFTYSGAINLQDMINAYKESLYLLKPDDPLMYRVVHVESLESNFADILKMAQSSASTAPNEERPMALIVVGHDKWTKLYLQLMSQRQFGGTAIPCFQTVEQALEYVREQTEMM
jgi:hypothetical protein